MEQHEVKVLKLAVDTEVSEELMYFLFGDYELNLVKLPLTE